MLVVVFNIGSPSYAEPALAVLKDYFERYRLSYKVVETDPVANVAKAHPSWLKLLAHELFPGHDYILNWDLDLLPVRRAPDIYSAISMVKLSMAVDSSLIAGYPGFNRNFRYNGGLLGIPQHMDDWCRGIYKHYAPGTYPSYEQYYLNDAIVRNKVDVHRIPDEFNTLYPRNVTGNKLWQSAVFKHYTFGVMSSSDKLNMIMEHKNDYFSA